MVTDVDDTISMSSKLIKASFGSRQLARAEELRGGRCGATTLLDCVVGEAVYSLAKFLFGIVTFSFLGVRCSFLGVTCSFLGLSLQAFFQAAIGV